MTQILANNTTDTIFYVLNYLANFCSISNISSISIDQQTDSLVKNTWTYY